MSNSRSSRGPRPGYAFVVIDPPMFDAYMDHVGSRFPLSLRIRHVTDGYIENRPLWVSSVEEGTETKPHRARGVLRYDKHRPEVNRHDEPKDANVVVEVWPKKGTYVYFTGTVHAIP